MTDTHDSYISPLSTRYASKEMQAVFSQNFKFRTWRRLWIALARAEKKLGLAITDEQIAEMEAHRDDINYAVAEEQERRVRHDVMAHVYAFGQQCPKAEPIIHLGATSCYVGDNTDIVILREASRIVLGKAAQVVRALSDFAERYKALPCLAYTHLQPAQLTTVGKRATLWINELLYDIKALSFELDRLQLLGSKGTTGTQASFMELFDGDEEKIDKMEQMIAAEMGFSGCVPVSGQTYSRKIDYYFLSALSGFAQSAYKFAGDLRILQSFKVSTSVDPVLDNEALRVMAGALCDCGRTEPRHDRADAVVRAHARRQRQQAHRRFRGVFGGGCHPQHLHECCRGTDGVRKGHPPSRDGKAAVHGDRECSHGVGAARRRPSGAA